MASARDGLEPETESGEQLSPLSCSLLIAVKRPEHVGVLALAQLTCLLVINAMDFIFPQETYLSVSSLMMGCLTNVSGLCWPLNRGLQPKANLEHLRAKNDLELRILLLLPLEVGMAGMHHHTQVLGCWG